MKDEFYIGYIPKAPRKVARFVVSFVVVLFIIAGAVSFFLSTSLNFINNGTYEYDELTEVKGVINMEPVPYIRILADDESKIGKNIMLIDLGKFGARPTIELMQEKIGDSISEFEVTIRGTLIYQDGMTLLELTEQEKALQDYQKLTNVTSYKAASTVMKNKVLKGEIVDPKCYFGSMKPGQSKPHRSCAVLCISGGIPPVFVVQTPEKTAEYYILKGVNGNDINEEVLDYVADATSIEGMVTKLNEWNIFYIDPHKIKRLD